ncbi:MAG: DUF3568 family protein [Lentisphaeraceae bacterium]|nr:DUF3568 family protein [Lentisphaeraceae bacterium]
MKSVFKIFTVLLILFSTVSCIEIAVGGAVAAGGSYVAKQGFIEGHFDRSTDSCWQITDEFVRTIDGEITYHSQNEGVIKIDFAEGGSATFKVVKVTNRATKVSIRAMRYALPSNDLANAYFEPLAEKLN